MGKGANDMDTVQGGENSALPLPQLLPFATTAKDERTCRIT